MERLLRRTTIDCKHNLDDAMGRGRCEGLEPWVEKGLLIFILDLLLVFSLIFDLMSLTYGGVEARVVHCGRCRCPGKVLGRCPESEWVLLMHLGTKRDFTRSKTGGNERERMQWSRTDGDNDRKYKYTKCRIVDCR